MTAPLFRTLPLASGTYDGRPASIRWLSGDEVGVVSGGVVVQSMIVHDEKPARVLPTLRSYLDGAR